MHGLRGAGLRGTPAGSGERGRARGKLAETVTFGGGTLDRAAELRGTDLDAALRQGSRAQTILTWRGKPLVAEGALAPILAGGREQLTNREQTILLQLAQGRSNKEVALVLDISVRTVETHRKNIKRKLGISSTAGLTRYALEHGVLQGTGVNG